jgi:putative transcriptional regulator
MNKDMFNELLDSVQDMDGIIKGQKMVSLSFQYPDPEVKSIRERLGVSEEKFSVILGVSKRSIGNWEQSRRHPTAAARSLLRIVAADPVHAMRALRA